MTSEKKFLLSGYFGFKNFGDEAILSVLVNKLNSLGYKNITIISSNPQYTCSQFNQIRSIKTFDFSKIFVEIISSDILISGGGSLLQDVTSIKSLFYYLFVIFIGLIFGKKVIIFAQGIGPINNPLGQFFTKILLKKCHYVSVRDTKSYDLLKTWGINADLLCDPIFSANVVKEKNGTVAIQLRNCRNLTNDFIDRLAQEVNSNFSDKNLEIYSFQDEIDLDICKKFEQNIKMLNSDAKTTILSGLSNNEIIEKLSKSEYLIAMRFHAIIIGLLAKCKILPINYDIKIEKISNEFNLPMLELLKPFNSQFKDLKSQDIDKIYETTSKKVFNWSGFENAIK